MRPKLSDREWRELGFIRAIDGAWLDNRDDFYSDHPDDFVLTYDVRKCTVISRSLLAKLLDLALADADRPENTKREAA